MNHTKEGSEHMYAMDMSRPVSCSMFGRMKQRNGWKRREAIRIDYNLLVFVIDGSAEFAVEGKRYNVRTGDVLILPAQTLYSASTDDRCEYYFFHFDGEICRTDCMLPAPPAPRRFSFTLSRVEERRIFFPPHLSLNEEAGTVCASVVSCMEYNARGAGAGRLLLDHEFMKILLALGEITELQQGNRALPPALNRVITYIKKNLTRPLRLQDVCENCKLSASYVERLFRRCLGVTATEYIHSEKMYYACELLGSASMNVTEIAEYLGYCDVYYFSKRFKRMFGVSPSGMLGRGKC